MREAARTPDDICRLFRDYMRAGDIEAVLTVYDPEAVFLDQSGTLAHGVDELREALRPLAASKPHFEFTIRQVVQSGNIALMHTEWTASRPHDLAVYAIEVARRQPDGTWRWLIGDPYTVGKYAASWRPGVSA